MTKKRGYFQITLDGKTYTGHISMTCLYLVTDLRKIGLEKIGEILSQTADAKNFSDIVFYALRANALRESKEEPFTNQWEFFDLMAENKIFENTSFVTEFTTALVESKIFANDENMGIPRKARKTTKSPCSHH